MNHLKLLPVWLLESQPAIFQTHQLRCISVFWNRPCDKKIAPAMRMSQMRFEIADVFWNRRCILKTYLRPELRRCDFRIAGAKLTYRSCGARQDFDICWTPPPPIPPLMWPASISVASQNFADVHTQHSYHFPLRIALVRTQWYNINFCQYINILVHRESVF